MGEAVSVQPPAARAGGSAEPARRPAVAVAERPMRVVYDVSTLGLGHLTHAHRAGIFRVVECVAEGLAGAPECELELSATLSVEASLHVLEYLRSAPALRGAAWPRRPLCGGLVRRMSAGLAALDRRGRGGFADGLARRLLIHGRRGVEAGWRATGRPRFRDADVFHSPRFALPSRRRTGRARRFLTVYDLIPLTHPEFCSAPAVREIEAILGSLRPDDWVLTISEHTRAELLGYRPDLDSARVFVTPLAADRKVFFPVTDADRLAEVRAKYAIPAGPYLLSVNTLESRKNVVRVIRAFGRLLAERPGLDLTFVMAGGMGWRHDEIIRTVVERPRLRDRIVVTGYVADPDLAPLYSGALSFVYPSLVEGFGLPPLEAMQCGTPVLASNASSLPEVVGDAGVLVDPADEDALCGAMWELYHDTSLRKRLGEASLARASRFSWERCVEQTLGAYRTALAA